MKQDSHSTSLLNRSSGIASIKLTLSIFICVSVALSGVKGESENLILNVAVGSDGKCLVYGGTDDPSLVFPEGISWDNGTVCGTTDYLTTKAGPLWTFNLTIVGHSNYTLFEIQLPQGTIIYDVESGDMDSLIYASEDSVRVSVQGWNITNPSIIVRYELTATTSDSKDMLLLIVILSAVFFIAFAAVKTKKPSKSQKPGAQQPAIIPDEGKVNIIRETLNERENQILDTLISFGGRTTQPKLQQYLNMPKASLARIVDHLSAKRVLLKRRLGRTNYLELHERLKQREEGV